MTLFEHALAIAVEAHRGQVDKDGKEYIRHVLRVMGAVGEGDQQIGALLHDGVEDSELTLADLRERGFPGHIVDAVDAMTRREGEDYFDFVVRAASNPLAYGVKVEDLRDNLRKSADAGSDERGEKYRKALRMLGEIQATDES